jgi:HEAT repeat protein
MLKSAGILEKRREAPDLERFKTMVERPMGTINASSQIMSDPSCVASFSKLLSDPNSRIRSRTAWSLGHAAAKKADIWAARRNLEGCLDDCDRDVAMAGAYALAMHYMNRSSKALERLKTHPSEPVRIGTNIAVNDVRREF